MCDGLKVILQNMILGWGEGGVGGVVGYAFRQGTIHSFGSTTP